MKKILFFSILLFSVTSGFCQGKLIKAVATRSTEKALVQKEISSNLSKTAVSSIGKCSLQTPTQLPHANAASVNEAKVRKSVQVPTVSIQKAIEKKGIELAKSVHALKQTHPKKVSAKRTTLSSKKAPQQMRWQEITEAQAVGADKHYDHAVFALKDQTGTTRAYLKKGTQVEIIRMKMFAALVDGEQAVAGGLRAQYPEIEIEYPILFDATFDDLSPSVQAQVNAQLESLENLRAPGQRLQNFFLMSAVDTNAMSWMNIQILDVKWYVKYMKLEECLLRALHTTFAGRPVSAQEWDAVKGFINRLNENGFPHGDLANNLFIKRNPQTKKLHLTFIDFELEQTTYPDKRILQNWEKILRKNGLFKTNPN